MKLKNALLLLTGVLPSISVFASANALEFDDRQSAVWEMEETYWRLASAGDLDGYVALWHDDFVGWTCSSWTPTGKANIGNWVQQIRDNDWNLTYELKPMAVQLFQDVAVVHYAAEYVFDFGDGTTKGAGEWRKFTHTWMQIGDSWQIIGGMCANQAPARTPNE